MGAVAWTAAATHAQWWRERVMEREEASALEGVGGALEMNMESARRGAPVGVRGAAHATCEAYV